MKTQILTWSFFIFISLTSLAADQNKEAMIQDLDSIKRLFEVGYAPAEWKKENDGWDLAREYEKTKEKISQSKNLSLKEYQQCLREFVSSLKDYHVGITFYSTEIATLPFRVKTIGKRTFIDYVNTNKLAKHAYSLRAGDELLEFNGVPIEAVMAELLKISSKNSNESTDQSMVDIKLTKRKGMLGDVVPKGPLTITYRSAENGEIKTNQLIWEYFPEYVKTPSNLMQTISFSLPTEPVKKKLGSQYNLFSHVHQINADDSDDEEGALGSRISFIPLLGSPTWIWEGKFEDEEEQEQSDEKEPENKRRYENEYPMWNAYIYENAEERSVGYIRIPHYRGNEEDVLLFGKIMGYMEKNTEALVVDQVNNYGGSVQFCYGLAGMLTSKALVTPRHRIKINQEDVYSGLDTIQQIDKVLSLMENGFLQTILEMLGFFDEPGINHQTLLFIKFFHEFIIEEWNEGRTLTNPIFIDGADIINPNPKYHYTKPILFLINELDFSGGDFMPAILQDNKRVTLFGTRTAGAGGYILHKSFPNKYGIASVGYTASIAERENKQKIESLGVTPDIEYKISESDVQDRYKNYAKTVNEVIATLLPVKEAAPEPEPESVIKAEPVEGEFEVFNAGIVYFDEESDTVEEECIDWIDEMDETD